MVIHAFQAHFGPWVPVLWYWDSPLQPGDQGFSNYDLLVFDCAFEHWWVKTHFFFKIVCCGGLETQKVPWFFPNKFSRHIFLQETLRYKAELMPLSASRMSEEVTSWCWPRRLTKHMPNDAKLNWTDLEILGFLSLAFLGQWKLVQVVSLKLPDPIGNQETTLQRAPREHLSAIFSIGMMETYYILRSLKLHKLFFNAWRLGMVLFMFWRNPHFVYGVSWSCLLFDFEVWLSLYWCCLSTFNFGIDKESFQLCPCCKMVGTSPCRSSRKFTSDPLEFKGLKSFFRGVKKLEWKEVAWIFNFDIQSMVFENTAPKQTSVKGPALGAPPKHSGHLPGRGGCPNRLSAVLRFAFEQNGWTIACRKY